MRLLFVVNPISGGIAKADIVDKIRTFCLQKIYNADFYFTEGTEKDKFEVNRRIWSNTYDAIVAVGGDGTVNLVGKQLIGKKIPLAIVPVGSGNGLSKDLGLPQDPAQALEIISNYNMQRIDTLSVNDAPVLHLADLGFNALIISRFHESETLRGTSGYAWHLLREYMTYEAARYTIMVENEASFGLRAFMVTIANGNAFGSNLRINPYGKLNDGLFELCILEEFPKTTGVNILYQLFDDGITDSSYAHVISCSHARIINVDNADFQIDGETQKHSPDFLDIYVRPESLSVLVSPAPVLG